MFVFYIKFQLLNLKHYHPELMQTDRLLGTTVAQTVLSSKITELHYSHSLRDGIYSFLNDKMHSMSFLNFPTAYTLTECMVVRKFRKLRRKTSPTNLNSQKQPLLTYSCIYSFLFFMNQKHIDFPPDYKSNTYILQWYWRIQRKHYLLPGCSQIVSTVWYMSFQCFIRHVYMCVYMNTLKNWDQSICFILFIPLL